MGWVVRGVVWLVGAGLMGAVRVWAGDGLEPVWRAMASDQYLQARRALNHLLQSVEDRTRREEVLVTLTALDQAEDLDDLMYPHLKALMEVTGSPQSYVLAYMPAFFGFIPDFLIGDYAKDYVAFVERLYDRLKHDPEVAPYLYLVNALNQRWMNKVDRARAAMEAVAVTEWALAGTFHNYGGSGWDTLHPPVDRVCWLKDSFVGRWGVRVYPVVVRSFMVSPGEYFYAGRSVAYLQTFMYIPKRDTLYLTFWARGMHRLWIDDHLISEDPHSLHWYPGSRVFRVVLSPGYHRILVEVGRTGSGDPFWVLFVYKLPFSRPEYIRFQARCAEYSRAGLVHVERVGGGGESYLLDRIRTSANPLPYLYTLVQYKMAKREYSEAYAYIKKMDSLAAHNLLTLAARIAFEDEFGAEPNQNLYVQRLRDYASSSVRAQILHIADALNEEQYGRADSIIQVVEDRYLPVYGEALKPVLLSLQVVSAIGRDDLERLKRLAVAFTELAWHDPDIVELQANLYLAQGKRKDAEKTFRNYLKKHWSEEVAFKLMDFYEEVGQSWRAVALLEDLIEKKVWDNSPGPFYFVLGKKYIALQEYERAVEALHRSVQMGPYKGNRWRLYGYVLLQVGDTAEAVRAFRRTLALYPYSYGVWEDLERLLFDKPLRSVFAWVDPRRVDWSEKVRAMPEGFRRAPAVIVDRRFFLLLYPGGASRIWECKAIRVQTQEGARQLQEFRLPYYADEVEQALIIKRTGEKIEGDVREEAGVILFDGLEPGDIIYVQSTSEFYPTGNLFAYPYLYYPVPTVGSPVLSFRFEVLKPRDLRVHIRVEGLDRKSVERRGVPEGWELLMWEAREIPAVPDEGAVPGRAGDYLSPYVLVSGLRSWRSFASDYMRVFRLMMEVSYPVLDDSLRALGLFGQPIEDTLSFVFHVIRTLNRRIKYSFTPLRQDAFIPRLPESTYFSQSGDCKDMTGLVAYILHKNGIPVDIWLVRTETQTDRVLQVPGYGFDHVIASVYTGGKQVYVDLTSPYTPAGSINYMNWGAPSLRTGLLEAGDSIEFIRPEFYVPSAIHSWGTIRVVDQQELRYEVWFWHIGQQSAFVRQERAQSTLENFRKQKAELLSYLFEGASVTLDSMYLPEDFLQSDTARSYYVLTLSGELKALSDQYLLRLPSVNVLSWFRLYSGKFSGRVRHLPLDLGGSQVEWLTDSLTLVLPEGWKVVRAPEDAHIETPYLKYTLRVHRVDRRTFRIVHRLWVRPYWVMPEEYAEVRSAYRSARKAFDQWFVLQPGR